MLMYCRWSQEGGNDAANSDWPDQIGFPPPPDSNPLLAVQYFDTVELTNDRVGGASYSRQAPPPDLTLSLTDNKTKLKRNKIKVKNK